MEEEKTAVIIVNWNAGKNLVRCLQSLTQQTRPPQRTILLDNASTDASLDGIAELFPNVEILLQTENKGFAEGNNIAVEHADDCEWIAFLNPDAFAEPDWLEQLFVAVKNHPEYSFFGSRMEKDSHPEILDGTGDCYHVSGLAWRRDHGEEATRTERATGEIFAPCAASAMIRRKDFLDLGGFDKRFFCYFEDVDLAFRLRLRGGRCLFVNSAKVRHVGSGTTQGNSAFSVYHGNRNLVWCYIKNMPGRLFWIYLPQHLLANIAGLIWYSLRGQSAAIFKAKWDALKGIPKAWRERKEIQVHTSIRPSALRRVLLKGIFLPYSKIKRRAG